MSSQAPPQKIEQLVQIIFDKTADKSIQWMTTPDEDAFRLSSETANVRIVNGSEVDWRGEDCAKRVLEIFNEKGRIVAAYRPRNDSQMRHFEELFDLARRSAYNTDDILDKLLKEISGKQSSAFE